MVLFEPIEPGSQVTGLPRRCQLKVEGGVARLRGLNLVGCPEPVECVFPDGVETAVAAIDRQHQRFRNQLADQVDHVSTRQARVGADLLACRQGEVAGKDRRAPKQHLFRDLQQVVAPVDRPLAASSGGWMLCGCRRRGRRDRSRGRSRISSTVIIGTRAAASSIASGIPSSRSQMRVTVVTP